MYADIVRRCRLQVGRRRLVVVAVAIMGTCFPWPFSDTTAAPVGDVEGSGLECGFRPAAEWMEELQAAYRGGEIPDPAGRIVPPVLRTVPPARGGPLLPLTHEDIFLFEDTNGLLLTDFSDGALFDLMIVAANSLLAVHGDNYDFVGYWLNFAPHHEIGAAFHLSFENDVMGIGAELYQLRQESGLGGDHIEGFVMMWNVNSAHWQAGSGPEADYTRLVLCHEFEHRFGVFLPDLTDGRRVQGGCGYEFHWNLKVDGQGSAMDLSEWVGSSPASLVTSFGFNADIPGGAYSYTDLYLMGYVTPDEMDAGNSELRFMDNWNCLHPLYFGAVSHFSSDDIVDAAGPRIPDAASEDKHYRTGWIMIHRPGDAPDAAELDKAIGILEQNTADWSTSTLGRGTMDHSLEEASTAARDHLAVVSDEVHLAFPAPNPSATTTLVRFKLSRATSLTLTVHDVGGRVVAVLMDDRGPSGWNSLRWDGRNGAGIPVASGTYFVRLRTEMGSRVAKIAVVK